MQCSLSIAQVRLVKLILLLDNQVPTDGSSQMTIDQTTLSQVTVGQMTVEQMTVSQVTIGQMTVGQITTVQKAQNRASASDIGQLERKPF